MSPHSSISRASTPRAWRSMSKPPTPATSVSLVFAEPEQSDTLQPSAAAVLSPKQQSSQLDSPKVPPSRRRDATSSLRKASLSSLNNRAKDAADAASIRHTTTPSVDTTFGNNPNPEGSAISALPEYPIPNGSSNPSPPVSQHTGWFGSLGRKRLGHSGTIPTYEPPVEQDLGISEPDPPQPPKSVPFPTSSATSASNPKPSASSRLSSDGPAPTPAPVPLPDPIPSSSSAPVPPPLHPTRQATPPQDIPPPRATATSSWFTRGHAPASSIDDTVPILRPFPDSPSLPEPASVRPRARADSNLSTLNPSTSRFMLSMPLLGRPKLPLEEVLQVQAKDTESVTVKAKDIEPESEITPSTPPSPPPQAPLSESGSWWSYIGLSVFSSTVALPPSPQPPSVGQSPTLPDEPVVPSVTPTPEAPASPSADDWSAWYTPWRWYGTSTETVVPPPPPVKTQAELVKEAALARPDVPTPGPPPPPSVHPDPNPVVGTPESRASWVSFFAYAGARGRAIKETGEMEVMRIDEDEAQAGPRSGLASRTESPAPSVKAPMPPLVKNPPASSLPPSPKKKPPSIRASAPPRAPNLLLPSFDDIFRTPPRSIPVQTWFSRSSTLRRALRWVIPSSEGEPRSHVGDALPRLWDVLGSQEMKSVRRVVVVGIHGWFPGALLRQVVGEPTGTSSKFASMMAAAVEAHFGEGVLEKLTQIVLEGEGTIERRVTALYQEYLNHAEWVQDLQKADAILIATHSQGSIVATQLIDRLIQEGHIRTHKGAGTQRVCCLSMCGIHLGPLRYLNTSSLVQPYLQYFESAAARELFEFQDSGSQVARTYVQALNNVLDHGTKFVYVASMNDQVVPIYSGSFTTATHPLLLRALYLDGEAYSSSDFVSNLLVLLLRIRNAGLDDGGLVTHLSEATAGSLSGVGHSSAYEEPATYTLAVRFLFETSGVLGEHEGSLDVQPFTARAARNDYEIPWALRDVIANPDVSALFATEFAALRAEFDDWHPRTTILRELRRKLEPIRRLPTSRL